MTLTERQYALLQQLSKTPEVTIPSLCQELNVSPPTVREELQNLEPLFERYSIRVAVQDGQIQLYGKRHLDSLISENRVTVEFSVSQKMLLILLLEQDYVTLQEIADVLYLSRSKTEKEIPALLQEHRNEISSRRHYGLRYCGTWNQRFRCFVQLLAPYLKGMDLTVSFEMFERLHFPIFQYISRQEMGQAQTVLERILQNDLFCLTDASQRQLFLYLLLVQRLKETFAVSTSEQSTASDLMLRTKSDELWQLVEQINQEFSLLFSESEKTDFYYVLWVLLQLPSLFLSWLSVWQPSLLVTCSMKKKRVPACPHSSWV